MLNRHRLVSRHELVHTLWEGELPQAPDAALSTLLAPAEHARRRCARGKREPRLSLGDSVWVDVEAGEEGWTPHAPIVADPGRRCVVVLSGERQDPPPWGSPAKVREQLQKRRRAGVPFAAVWPAAPGKRDVSLMVRLVKSTDELFAPLRRRRKPGRA